MPVPIVKGTGNRAPSPGMNEQQADTTDENDTGRSLRADARRNRARILEVAVEAFAAEGLSVPVQEIARRAGVGTGTVSKIGRAHV